jgi:hypothetical protein
MSEKQVSHIVPANHRHGLAKCALGLLAAIAMTLAGSQARAQAGSDGWEFTLAPYVVGAAMDGVTTVKGVEVDVDVPFDTILENLDMTFMGHFDMQNERWLLSSDLIYMDLEANAEFANGTTTATMQETLFEVAGGYRVTPAVTLLAGARYVDLGVGLSYAGPSLEQDADASKSWVDPFVGAHVTAALGERWWLGVHGDVGGFGVGSELAWQAYANVGFRASDLVSVVAGYRAFDVDYQDGSGDDLFRYDVLTAGPQIGVVFCF